MKLKKNETVVFSWITYKSRKHRDAVMKKVMTDKRLADMMKPEAHAVRQQTHDLRRLQELHRSVTRRSKPDHSIPEGA